MLREPLDEGANDHDHAAAKDGPSPSELVVDDGDERKGQDGAKRVGGGDNALQAALRVTKV